MSGSSLRLGVALLAALLSVATSEIGYAQGSPAAVVSKYRVANGLSPVKPDPALTRMASAQAQAMARASVMSHSIGGEFTDRLRQTGFRYGAAAENIGVGYVSFGHAMQGWIDSSDHRSNLLLEGATRIGAASARGAGGRLYWALVLASPRAAERAGGPYAAGARAAPRRRAAAVPFPFNLFSSH